MKKTLQLKKTNPFQKVNLFALTSIFCLSTLFSNAQAVSGYLLDNNATDSYGTSNGTLESYNAFFAGTVHYPVAVPGHTGAANTAYHFEPEVSNDGAGRIGFGLPSNLNFSTYSFSISLWFKYSGLPSSPAIISNVGGAFDTGLLVALQNNSGSIRPRFFLGSTTGGTTASVDVLIDSVLVPNTWYQMAVTVDTVANLVKCYLGGTQIDIMKNPSYATGGVLSGQNLDYSALSTTTAAPSGILQFAMSANFFTTHFSDGFLDDVFFFNRALTSTEVSGLFGGVIPLGVEDYKNEKLQFRISPNPATNFVSIKNESEKNVTANIYEVTGKLVESISINNFQTNIDLTKYENGIYLIQFSNGQSIKFIKQ